MNKISKAHKIIDEFLFMIDHWPIPARESHLGRPIFEMRNKFVALKAMLTGIAGYIELLRKEIAELRETINKLMEQAEVGDGGNLG